MSSKNNSTTHRRLLLEMSVVTNQVVCEAYDQSLIPALACSCVTNQVVCEAYDQSLIPALTCSDGGRWGSGMQSRQATQVGLYRVLNLN